MPKTHPEYWNPKLERNRQRDAENIRKLEADGWNVIVVWECFLKPAKRDATLNGLVLRLREYLSGKSY